MGAELQITRTAVIVVDTVDKNSYGDLVFTDKEGTQYKISAKRVQYFEKIIQPDTGVELSYANAYGKEYIYSARQVKDGLPPPQKPNLGKPVEKPDHLVQEAKKMGAVEEKMSKQDWNDKDAITRRSIERQKSADLAVQMKISGNDKTFAELADAIYHWIAQKG